MRLVPTRSSRGFGLSWCKRPWTPGCRGGNRAPAESTGRLVDVRRERIMPVALDVTDASAAAKRTGAARERLGSVDVVVNNAGYANVAPIETGDDEDFRVQFETNSWGVPRSEGGAADSASPGRRADHPGRVDGGAGGWLPGASRHICGEICDRRVLLGTSGCGSAVRRMGPRRRVQRFRHRLGRAVDVRGSRARDLRRNRHRQSFRPRRAAHSQERGRRVQPTCSEASHLVERCLPGASSERATGIEPA